MKVACAPAEILTGHDKDKLQWLSPEQTCAIYTLLRLRDKKQHLYRTPYQNTPWGLGHARAGKIYGNMTFQDGGTFMGCDSKKSTDKFLHEDNAC
jgi:hypothetical protein